jgi:ribosomal protein L24
MVKKRTTYEGVKKVDLTLENVNWRLMIIIFSGEEAGKERTITEEVANQVTVNGCRVRFVGKKASVDSPEGKMRIVIDHDLTENVKTVEISQ